MGNVHPEITDKLRSFIDEQHLFFVATAPGSGGHINLSPKGLDTFAVLGPLEVAYLDITGSGVETISHLRDNGRITLMFCAFKGKPDIVRLQGSGEAVMPDDERFDELRGHFGAFDGVRSVIRVDLDRVSDSCGYAVPLMEFKGDRRALTSHWADTTDAELAAYHRERNGVSIDGLPGY